MLELTIVSAVAVCLFARWVVSGRSGTCAPPPDRRVALRVVLAECSDCGRVPQTLAGRCGVCGSAEVATIGDQAFARHAAIDSARLERLAERKAIVDRALARVAAASGRHYRSTPAPVESRRVH